MEQMASLHFMEWDDHILEEDDMLLSKRHSKPGDDAGKDVQ